MTRPHLMTHIRRKHNNKVPVGTKTLTRGVGRPQHTFKRFFTFFYFLILKEEQTGKKSSHCFKIS